jgi:hypothetical protein
MNTCTFLLSRSPSRHVKMSKALFAVALLGLLALATAEVSS